MDFNEMNKYSLYYYYLLALWITSSASSTVRSDGRGYAGPLLIITMLADRMEGLYG